MKGQWARDPNPFWALLSLASLSFWYMQIAREAEAAVYHRQLFEELRRAAPLSRDPTEVTAIGAVEAAFKCCAAAIIVLTTTGR